MDVNTILRMMINKINDRLTAIEAQIEKLNSPKKINLDVTGRVRASLKEEEPIPEVDPFHDWAVKPGMWVEWDNGEVFKVESVGNKLKLSITDKDDSLREGKERIECVLHNKWLRILTPAEVEAHEKKIKYPVLAPWDKIEFEEETYNIKADPSETNFVFPWCYQETLGPHTQAECAAKLASGEWVKYVKEVQP